jgi:hypothetical protein
MVVHLGHHLSLSHQLIHAGNLEPSGSNQMTNHVAPLQLIEALVK